VRLYANYIGKPARLFRSDAQKGWSNAPNLQTTLINAADEESSIRTDENGQRRIAQNPGAKCRVLLLGDSLSFGDGIDIKDRFDAKPLSLPAWRARHEHQHHGLRNRPGVRGCLKLEARFGTGRYRSDSAQ
jgi:hypothetical protein